MKTTVNPIGPSVFLAFLFGALSSCASVRGPATGVFYTDTKSPVAVTSNSAGTRVGEACAGSYFGAVAVGDASIETARRNAGITQVTSVDESSTSFLGIYGKYCVIVRGR